MGLELFELGEDLKGVLLTVGDEVERLAPRDHAMSSSKQSVAINVVLKDTAHARLCVV